MSSTHRNISNHKLVESYERDVFALRKAGVSDDLAERFAAVLTWDKLGLTAAEKRAEYGRHFPGAQHDES